MLKASNFNYTAFSITFFRPSAFSFEQEVEADLLYTEMKHVLTNVILLG